MPGITHTHTTLFTKEWQIQKYIEMLETYPSRGKHQTEFHRYKLQWRPFIATQLNSTRRRSVYSDADATQLNSTQVLRPDDATNSTELNSTSS